jgi:class 3 adenylate cyclase
VVHVASALQVDGRHVAVGLEGTGAAHLGRSRMSPSVATSAFQSLHTALKACWLRRRARGWHGTRPASSSSRGRASSGTVTFLFTDVEGSTRLLQELGDRIRG